MWFVGIDWADQKHEVVVIDETGQSVATRSVAHSAEGLADLVEFLSSVCHQELSHLACVVETNTGLLISTLLEAGVPIYPVNPKTLEKWRKPSGAKTDAIDAFLLARKGRSDWDQLQRLEPDSSLVQELKQLTRDQEGLIQMQTRLVNQITACLKAYFPLALEVFAQVHQRVTLAFLQAYPTLEALQHATEDDIGDLLRSVSYPHPQTKARTIREQLQQPCLHADAVTTRTKSRLLAALVQQLRAIMDAIAAYDTEIERLFGTHPDATLFGSLPGAGKRLAPRLLAEWGDDRTRYPDANSVQALAGTAPVTFQSGKFARVHRRYACNKGLRNTFHHFAWQSTRLEPWALAYYQRKRREGKTHPVALRSLANQWIRIIFAAWRQHQVYDVAVFLAAQQAHGTCAA